MASLIEPFLEEIKKKTQVVQLVLGFAAVGSNFIGYFSNPLLKSILVALGIFLVVFSGLTALMKARKKSAFANDDIPSYHPKIRKAASVLRVVSAFLTLGYMGWASYDYWTYDPCKDAPDSYTLLVSSFGKKDGDFTMRLFNGINVDLIQEVRDTILLKRDSIIFSPWSSQDYDNLRDQLGKKCIQRGLWVFGNRNIESQNFDCYIYLSNLVDSVTNKSYIYLKNPDRINFSIDYQADFLSKFILGLLYGKSGDQTLSQKYLKEAIDLNKNEKNTEYLGYCHFFLGNSYAREGRFDLAGVEFQKGLDSDPTNQYLYNNLAFSLLSKGDTVRSLLAFKELGRFDPSYQARLKSFVPFQKYIPTTVTFGEPMSVRHNRNGSFDIFDSNGALIERAYFEDAHESMSFGFYTGNFSVVSGTTTQGKSEIWFMTDEKNEKFLFNSTLQDSILNQIIYNYKENHFVITEEDGKFGLNSLDGERRLERIYDYVERVQGSTPSSPDLFIYRKDKLYGVYSDNPYFRFPPKFKNYDSLKKSIQVAGSNVPKVEDKL